MAENTPAETKAETEEINQASTPNRRPSAGQKRQTAKGPCTPNADKPAKNGARPKGKQPHIGRPKGAKDKRTRLLEAYAKEHIVIPMNEDIDLSNPAPGERIYAIEFLRAIYRLKKPPEHLRHCFNAKAWWHERTKAAIKCMDYESPKLAATIQTSSQDMSHEAWVREMQQLSEKHKDNTPLLDVTPANGVDEPGEKKIFGPQKPVGFPASAPSFEPVAWAPTKGGTLPNPLKLKDE